jgi:pimeloyl-ACP methyl ester carboxylesterase
MNWLRKKRTYLSFALFGFLIYSYDFLELRLTDDTFIERLNDNPYGYTAEIHRTEVDGHPMRYIEIGDDNLPLIVFIHGAPSSSSFWETMLEDSILLKNAKLLAVDRPGYGYSNFGRPDTSIQHQAALIAAVIKTKRAQHDQIILHGSSYGGTVSARLAMDYPELVDGVLFQSASLAPGEEKTYLFTHLTASWPLNWLIPRTLHVANHEKLSHRSQLQKMVPLWNRIKSACMILHGTDDQLIYPVNAWFAKERLVNASFLEFKMLEGRKHDLLWNKRDLLIQSLLKLIKVTKNKWQGTEALQKISQTPYE